MIESTSLGLFALALALAAGSPGPSIAALVSRVIANGWRDVLPFVCALWVGEILWMTLAVAGHATLADQFSVSLKIIKYCGVAYLAFLAWQMWTTPVQAIDVDTANPVNRSHPGKMLLAGMSVSMSNPKVMLFYLALLPTLIDMTNVTFSTWLTLAVTMLIILAIIDLGYMVLANQARRLFRTPRAIRLANRIGATTMGAAAALIVTR